MSILKKKIKEVRPSIIAIGYRPEPNKITIIGSGFSVSSDGHILSVAHLFTQIKPEHHEKLLGMVMNKKEGPLEGYGWQSLQLINKNDKNDLALFQMTDTQNTFLRPLELGDSEEVEVGQDIYFIGFPYAAQLINDGMGITLIANRGIVSNIKHDGQKEGHPRNFIIVDAISNPGNSGCPLIDVETNKVLGVMAIAFRTRSRVQPNLDIREPMHIAGAKPINLAKDLLKD